MYWTDHSWRFTRRINYNNNIKMWMIFILSLNQNVTILRNTTLHETTTNKIMLNHCKMLTYKAHACVERIQDRPSVRIVCLGDRVTGYIIRPLHRILTSLKMVVNQIIQLHRRNWLNKGMYNIGKKHEKIYEKIPFLFTFNVILFFI